MRTHYKIPIILVLIITIPLLLLGWMGVRLQSNEKIVRAHQFQQLVDSRLREADQEIIAYFSSLERSLLATPIFYTTNSDFLTANQAKEVYRRIRRYVRSSPYIENIFILNTEGQRLYPPSSSLASKKERQFIERTEALWSDMAAFRPRVQEQTFDREALSPKELSKSNPKFSVSGSIDKFARNRRQVQKEPLEIAPATEASQAFNEYADAATTSLASTDIAPDIRYGWTVWYANTESQTFFWFWDQQNNLVGLKLSAVHWLSELIGQLPDDHSAAPLIGQARIKLLNEKQTVVHQWGSFEDAAIEAQPPQGQHLLTHPLGGWRLVYFSPEIPSGHSLQWLLYLALLVLLALMLAGLGFFIMREYRRDMQVAQQRVTFVNQVSHELKTPLTNICMYADLLDAQVADKELVDESLVHKYCHILTTESQRLGRLINNVLRFSRSQRKQTQLNPTVGIVDQTIHTAVNMFAPAFATKGIVVELHLAASQRVCFDAEALEQVINNLLSNIEKYAHQGKQAHITSTQQKNITTITVQDSGPGIDSKVAKNLFTPFYRGSSKLTEGVSGTGIGLNIARELCRLHGGDLTLSETPHSQTIPSLTGACFMITIETPTPQDKP